MDPSGDSLAAPNQQDFRHNEGSRGDDGNNLTELGAGQRLSRPSSTRPSLSGASSPGSPPPAGAAPPNHGERPPSGSLSLSESTPSLLQPSDDSSRHEGSRFDLDSLNHSPASTAATSGVNAAGKGDVNRQPGDFLDLAQSEVARDAQAQHDINAVSLHLRVCDCRSDSWVLIVASLELRGLVCRELNANVRSMSVSGRCSARSLSSRCCFSRCSNVRRNKTSSSSSRRKTKMAATLQHQRLAHLHTTARTREAATRTRSKLAQRPAPRCFILAPLLV